MDDRPTAAGATRHVRDIVLSALGPLGAFAMTFVLFMSGREVAVQTATPLFFIAVLMGAAFAGRWSALSTAAIAAIGLFLGADEESRGTAVIAVAALVAAGLITGELRDRAERAENTARIANTRLQRVSLRDPLTGLLDRRGFDLAIGVEIARETRSGGTLSVLLLRLADLVGMKERMGSSIPDTIVQVLADAVERRVRQSDIAARVSDDQLAVILPDTDAAGSGVIASQLIASFQRDLRGVMPADVVVQADYGVGVFPGDGRTADELLASAARASRAGVSGSART